jgi:hypothetical protein
LYTGVLKLSAPAWPNNVPVHNMAKRKKRLLMY